MTRREQLDALKLELIDQWVQLDPLGQELVMQAYESLRSRRFPRYETEEESPEGERISGGAWMWPDIERLNYRECAGLSQFIRWIVSEERHADRPLFSNIEYGG